MKDNIPINVKISIKNERFQLKSLSNIKNIELYLMLVPVILYFIIFEYWPMAGIQIAFKDYSITGGMWNSEWVGFEHFERFFNSYYFWRLIKNTIGISLYGLLLSTPGPIILALIINEINSKYFKKSLQTITYFPHFLSAVILVGMVTTFLSLTGPLNQILKLIDIEPMLLMQKKKYFKTVFVLQNIWQNTGWSSIIYMAVLASIDPSLYEAAEIDGASRIQKIWNVTIPFLLPTLITLLILDCGKVMNVGHEKILLMQNPLNLESSEVISTYVYKQGIVNSDYSFGTAIGIFKSITNLILVCIVNAISKKVSETSLW